MKQLLKRMSLAFNSRASRPYWLGFLIAFLGLADVTILHLPLAALLVFLTQQEMSFWEAQAKDGCPACGVVDAFQ